MKTIIAALVAASAVASVASVADAQPRRDDTQQHRRHVRVCTVRHHHRVCTWSWR
jgi:hypothetical protein